MFDAAVLLERLAWSEPTPSVRSAAVVEPVATPAPTPDPPAVRQPEPLGSLQFGQVAYGWTADGWAGELRRKAGCCQEAHPATAETYRAWVVAIEKNSLDRYANVDILDSTKAKANP